MPEYLTTTEAVQWTGDNAAQVLAFAQPKIVVGENFDGSDLELVLETPTGAEVPLFPGQWVVRALGGEGGFWPLQPQEFGRRFQEV